jgi:4-amino-4-deoxy-L-arabinose transferase-like glycosyltransferase
VRINLEYWRNPATWPALICTLAAFLLLLHLGAGLWEPQELAVAVHARERLEQYQQREQMAEAARAAEERGEVAAAPPKISGALLTPWLVSHAIDSFGQSEWAARLPLALLGLIAVLATYALAARLASPRAGLFASLCLLSAPLFLLQATHLNSDIGVVAGSALLFWAATPRPIAGQPGRDCVRAALDAVLIAAGALLCYAGGGVLIGLLPPLLGLAAGAWLNKGATSGRGWRHAGFALLAAALAAALLLVIAQSFDVREGYPGERALFGLRPVAAKLYSVALGGTWRTDPALEATFDVPFEQIGFGFFPWSAIAPFAVAWLGLSWRGKQRAGSIALLLWALAAYLFTAVFARQIGPAHYPALVALAVAVGWWIDDYLQPNSDGAGGVGARLPLLGLFAALAALIISRDIAGFPKKLVSLPLLEGEIAYPERMRYQSAVPIFGAAFGVALLWALAVAGSATAASTGSRLRRWIAVVVARVRRWRAHGVVVALAIGLAFATYLVFIWSRGLTQQISTKPIFEVYREQRAEGERLGLLQTPPELEFYAGSDFEKLQNRGELRDLLSRPERVFAVIRGVELCQVHRDLGTPELPYFVLDAENATYLLLSNRLGSGESDENPLARAIVRQPPEEVGTPLHGTFDDQLELVGVDMPESVERGATFSMTLHFKVLKPITYNWKIFVHFDAGSARFQGDHDAIAGRCATNTWQPGDYINDTFEVEAGGIGYPKTNYRGWVGFYRGSPGSWINMPAHAEGAVGDRVPIGDIELR